MTERNVYTALAKVEMHPNGDWFVWKNYNSPSRRVVAHYVTRAQATAIAAVLNLLDELDMMAEPIDPNPTCGSDENAPVNFRHPREAAFAKREVKDCKCCGVTAYTLSAACPLCGEAYL